MLSAGSLFLISVTLFLLYAVVVRVEWGKGQRIFLSRLRGWLDEKVSLLYEAIVTRTRRLIRHTVKLSWYYSIHKTLRAVLTVLVKLYDNLELIFINNRERAKQLRAERRALREEKNHLTMIGEHKAQVALTPKEKKKLKEKSLAGK